jgi:hypothetical protein
MKKRNKAIFVILGIIVVIYLGVYTVLTPFIRGVVVDEKTKQPIENAWVMATAGTATRTIAGDTGGTYAISSRHLRTGKDGIFYVFPKLYPSIPTPFTFGNMKKSLNITVRVMDGRRAEMNLTRDWWKRLLFVTIPMQYVERTNAQINSELSGLSAYCTSGGYFFVQGKRAELCDMWELEYVIAEHERFIQALKVPKNVLQETYYSGTLRVIANLYRKKGDYRKSLQYLIDARNFDKKRGTDLLLHNYESQINELEKEISKTKQ